MVCNVESARLLKFAILALCLSGLSFSRASADVMFNWATVGNPGNGNDTTGFGAVGSTYRISKHEVTNSQYTEFLNAVDPTGANARGLFNSSMAGNFGGIENTGTTDGARYVARAGRENNPVTFVSWIDAARFVNWLNNGQGSGSTESGVYTINNGLTETRGAGATYFLPTENEWYKAAYHDATAGTAAAYFDYPTRTDTVPYSDNPNSLNTPDNSNTANFVRDDGLDNGFNDGFAVSGSTTFPDTTNPLTDVGAYSTAVSPYGTFDQAGNVWEWNENLFDATTRVVRGGSWAFGADKLIATNRDFGLPTDENSNTGFRVANIPEPSAFLYGGVVVLGLLVWKWLTRWSAPRTNRFDGMVQSPSAG